MLDPARKKSRPINTSAIYGAIINHIFHAA